MKILVKSQENFIKMLGKLKKKPAKTFQLDL